MVQLKRWLLHKYLKIRTTLPFVYLCNKAFHSSYRQVKQKIKDRKQENHEKFFLGSVLISFFKSQNIEMNYLENTLKMIELYQIKNYFRKELFLESEIKEFKFSEQGRSFNDKKNVILSDPKSPFKK